MTAPNERMMQLARLTRDDNTTDGERHNAGRALAKMVLERGAPEGVDAAEVARLRAKCEEQAVALLALAAASRSASQRASQFDREAAALRQQITDLRMRAEHAEREDNTNATRARNLEHELAALRCAVAALPPEHLVELHARELEARAGLDERRRVADEKLAKLDAARRSNERVGSFTTKEYSYANVTFDLGGMGTDQSGVFVYVYEPDEKKKGGSGT